MERARHQKIREHLDMALSKDVGSVDPHFAIKGVGASAKMVKEFRRKFPDASFVRASEIDIHHDRARYSWSVMIDETTRRDSVDAVQVSKKSGIIKRIGSFVGALKPL